ncbi:MAG: diphosphomevalonate decarboxylase [Legionellales bacterium RIFCSPHIGHO2_12_FULL_35_11]|nr:MAG: diphosphomevalonate decarboxylase [Legionellales bacterium RIFCSPHIGHO2_12_FULL_35_11]
MQKWHAIAPSNIALIKYMGKRDSTINLPDNPSLSYTLDNLISEVSIELSNFNQDTWEPLHVAGQPEISLSASAQEKFLKHFAFLKEKFAIKNFFKIKSNNNFPHSSGIASSASSFAALTKCAIAAFCELNNKSLPPIIEQASLSRIGSGSSCRSFFSPWALWEDDIISKIDTHYEKLHHEVIIISKSPKNISSSLAHQLIKTSPNYAARGQRAKINLKQLLKALNSKKWHDAYSICFAEFMDMHELFHTAEKSFSYINSESESVLKLLKDLWQSEQDGPIITMDAGPNIHLLYRLDQLEMADYFKNRYLKGNFDVL